MSIDTITQTSKLVLCCYVNDTNRVQIARIRNIPHWFFERVVFPGQRIIFEAPLEGKLEIHTNEIVGSILSETIHCRELNLTSTFTNYSYQ
jgi:hypothetical protein